MTAPEAGLDPALSEALRLHGLPPGKITAVVLLGADPDALAPLRAHLPARPGVLVVDPDPGRVARLAARNGGASAGPLRLARLGEPDDPLFALGLYLELAQFFMELAVAPGQALVVDRLSDRKAGRVGAGASQSLATVRDFCTGWSADFFLDLYEPSRVPVPVLRALADFLLAVDEPYHALKFYRLLHRQNPDLELGLRLLQCWVMLDCPLEVQRLLQGQCFEGQGELREKLRDQIAARLAQQEAARGATFARNVAALAPDNPVVAAALEEVTPADFIAVTLTGVCRRLGYDGEGPRVERGPYSMLVRAEGDLLFEVNPPLDPTPVHAALSGAEHAYEAHACVGRVVHHAAGAESLLANTVAASLPGWRRVCYFIEPELPALAALLAEVDLAGHLQRERVRLFAGPSAEADFLALLRGDADRVVPRVRLGVSPTLAVGLDSIERGRADRVADAYARLGDMYDLARTREILEVLEGRIQRPLRVLFVSSLYTSMIRHVVDDLAAAFRAGGHATRVLQETRPGQQLHHQSVTGQLIAFQPDFVFMVNHTRSAVPGAFPPGLPVVTWIQDELPLLKDPAHIRTLGTLDLTYAFSTAVAELHVSLGYRQVGHLPFAVNPASLAGEIPASCRDEIVYATRLVNLPELPSTPGLKSWLERRLAGVSDIPVSVPRLEPMVLEASAALGFPIPPESRHDILMSALMVAREADRIRVADTLVAAGLPLCIYGEGWEALPRFRPFVRGVVAPGEALWRVFRESKVVLHINRGCNIHPRLLEGFAAGGFVLARHDPADERPGETADLFDVGRELILYRGDDEMIATIRRAMTDEPWRRGVITAARRRIEARHSYRNRVEVILRDLRVQVAAHLREQAGGI